MSDQTALATTTGQRHRSWRPWRAIAFSAALVATNLVYFGWSLGPYLFAHQETGHQAGYLIDIQTVQDHVLITVWWQVVANGVLLLPFRGSRRIGVGLLVAAGLTFVLFLWVVLSLASQMG